MSNEARAILKERLRKNYEDFLAQLQSKSVSELIAIAPEITAAKQCHEELLDACGDDDVTFLLRLDDPLEIVRGYWENELTGHYHGEEMRHMLWRVREDIGDELEQRSKVPVTKNGQPSQAAKDSFAVQEITAAELRQMDGQEGLVLQGCGGDARDWVKGINEMLTEAGILQDGSRFESVSTFQYGDLTCLLFPFEDVELDMGRLAMWRIQTYGQFGGTWLSDYVPNRLGGFAKEQAPRQKPKMELQGRDSNIFALMGTASRLLQMAGMHDQNKEMIDRVTSCENYYKALSIISEYVETELSTTPKPQKSIKKKGRDAHER